MAHIRIVFAASGETYGTPRVHHDLRAAGLPTSTKRVRVITTDSNHDHPSAPNLLARQCDINGVALHRIWIGDITAIPTREGFLYLATV